MVENLGVRVEDSAFAAFEHGERRREHRLLVLAREHVVLFGTRRGTVRPEPLPFIGGEKNRRRQARGAKAKRRFPQAHVVRVAVEKLVVLFLLDTRDLGRELVSVVDEGRRTNVGVGRLVQRLERLEL